MKVYKAMASKLSGISKTTAKRFVKLIAICKDPALLKVLLQKSPDLVIKLICNAALNASQGDVHLTSSQKKLFTKNKTLFGKLLSPNLSLKAKRQIIIQRGGAFPLIPIIVSTVLSALGSAFLPK